MATPSKDGDYVSVDGVTVWWQEKDPAEIHFTLSDPDFTSEDTGPGLRVVFSSSPKSANYHPGNFNRCARVLRKYGKSAPANDVEEGQRRLDKR